MRKKKISKFSGIELFKKTREDYDSVLVAISHLFDKNINKTNVLNFFPLSLSSNKTFFHTGNDFYNYYDYKTDKFGFRNSNDEWSKDKIDFLFLGDSFLMGGDNTNSISANFKKLYKNKVNTLNLSQGGIGTLFQYAILREYIKKDRVKNVLLFYYEANDLKNLKRELNHPILNNYFTDKKFTQNLIKNQNKVDIFWNYFFANNEDIIIKRELIGTDKEIKYRLKKNKFEWLKFLKFSKLRELLIKNEFKPTSEFKTILNDINSLCNSMNANFYFIYVPEVNRYLYGVNLNNSSKYYSKIIEIVRELNINYIDLNIEFLENSTDPLTNYLYQVTAHPNNTGYENISKYIYNKIKN